MKKLLILLLLLITIVSSADKFSNVHDRMTYLEGKVDVIERDRWAWDWELVVIFGLLTLIIILIGIFTFINQRRFNQTLDEAREAAQNAQKATEDAKISAKKVQQIDNTLASYINEKISKWEIIYSHNEIYKFKGELPILVAQVEILESMGGEITPQASFFVGVYYYHNNLFAKAIKHFENALPLNEIATYDFLSWALSRSNKYEDALRYVDDMGGEYKYYIKLLCLLSLDDIDKAEEYYYETRDESMSTLIASQINNKLLDYYISKYREGDLIPEASVEILKDKINRQARHFHSVFDRRLVIPRSPTRPRNLKQILEQVPDIGNYLDISGR